MLSACAVEVQREARLGSTEEAAGSIPADRFPSLVSDRQRLSGRLGE
jgi:hypothetical protein